MKLGRRLTNTEIYPLSKIACVTLDAVRKIRIGTMQTSGQERKKHIAAYDEETEAGKLELIYRRIDRTIDDASRTADMTRNAIQRQEKSKISIQSRKGEEGAYQKEGNEKGGDRAGRKGGNQQAPGETEEGRGRTGKNQKKKGEQGEKKEGKTSHEESEQRRKEAWEKRHDGIRKTERREEKRRRKETR